MRRLLFKTTPIACVLLLLTACPSEEEEEHIEADAGGDDVFEEDVNDEEPLPEARSADCDPLMPDYCSMPWPSNLYLAQDDQRVTGYSLDFGEESLPVSSRGGGHAVDPTPYNKLDGYGWGTPVAVLFPGVDISRMPQEESIEKSFEDDDREAFYFKVTDDGLEPVPFWAELDVHAETPEEQLLYLRPGVILEPDTRYVVGFRNLVDDEGNPFERSQAFEAYLSGDAAEEAELAWRQERFDDIFALLDDAGIDGDELTLAWDFHTSSSESMHGDLLSIIEQGLAVADSEGIELTITSVDINSDDPDDPNFHGRVAFDIQGTFRVPHFMVESDRTVHTAYLMNRDDQGNPAQNGWREADFWMQIPWGAIDGTPHGLVKYGHGMLGSGSQVRGSFNQRLAEDYDLIFYGASFVGFSSEDVPQAVQALSEPTYFEEIADRMHQGVLEYVLLTQAMLQGLEDLPDDEAFDDLEEGFELTVDDDRVYYSGISQGGIYGVPVLAVDPAITRGHFGVGGHNYAMLMERSYNYFGESGADGYYFPLRQGFPERVDQGMVIPVIQLLWDKVDPISYQRHLSAEPFDEDHPKEGLFAIAKGDYQVAVVTNEIMARSGIDIPIIEPYDRERGTPWNVDVADYPHQGSGVVLYDFGNPWPPAGNAPPADGLGDPHGKPRRMDNHSQQMVTFFDTGVIEDACDGDYCYFPEE